LTAAILEVMERSSHEIREIGTRHGEKLYETLLSREERAAAEDLGEYFRVPPDDRDLNYDKFFELGEKRIALCEDYNSHNAQRLDVPGMKQLLMKLDLIRRVVSGETVAAEALAPCG
jgi:UDP-glucose 4-epimerase